jgi:hypothetical protein
MPAKPTSKTALDIEQLKREHKDLERKKITAEADLQTATATLNAIKREAKEKYGTDDQDELQKKLAEMKSENERKRAEYQKHLEEIGAKLAEVEREFTSPRSQE